LEAVEVTDEDINTTYNSRRTMRERLYAEVALNTAFDCRVFSDHTLQTVFLPTAENVHTEDLTRFRAWEEHLKAVCRREMEEGGPALFQNIDGAAPAVSTINEQPGIEPLTRHETVQRSTVPRPKRNLLKGDQRRAHDIIEKQLQKRLSGNFLT
jgi:hypothetical protein